MTDIKTAVDSFNTILATITQEILEYKPVFEAYIADRSIPLEERWNLWCSAPSKMKNQDSWIWHSENKIDGSWKLIDDLIAYEGENWGRGQDVDVADLMQNLQESIDWKQDNPDSKYGSKFSQADLDIIMEEALAENLESFGYDW